jgi:hypothetical protein
MRNTKMGITERDLGKKDSDVVIEMEKKFPVMTAEFKRIQQAQYELFCAKQSNYGPDNISMGSSLEREEDRKLSLQGLFFRLNDKINRYKQMIMFGSKDAVGESLDDTFKDISVYGIIAQLVQSGKWGK